MTGFTLRPQLPPPPPVFATAGATCPEKHPAEHVPCSRPANHKGGHRNKTRDLYWPATS